jgi:hypothetical protein
LADLLLRAAVKAQLGRVAHPPVLTAAQVVAQQQTPQQVQAVLVFQVKVVQVEATVLLAAEAVAVQVL